jgi:hypothetical protein
MRLSRDLVGKAKGKVGDCDVRDKAALSSSSSMPVNDVREGGVHGWCGSACDKGRSGEEMAG